MTSSNCCQSYMHLSADFLLRICAETEGWWSQQMSVNSIRWCSANGTAAERRELSFSLQSLMLLRPQDTNLQQEYIERNKRRAAPSRVTYTECLDKWLSSIYLHATQLFNKIYVWRQEKAVGVFKTLPNHAKYSLKHFSISNFVAFLLKTLQLVP